MTGGLRYSAGNNQGTTFPAWVEDRNGNQAIISDNGGGAITVTDSAGRAELKSSGFGATGNTLTVAGLANPYTLTWGSSSYNFTVPYHEVSVMTCGTAKQLAGGSYPTIQSLELPNGQSYKFYYETTYGLISEIVYPSGGWVKYTWGMNPTADIALFPNDSGNQNACAYQYGQPVVTKRQVSYDGTTIAEEQDFNTYGTTWNGSNNYYWTTKNATVTTQALGSSFNTTYLYTPINVGNNDPTSTSLFAPQAPVESQVSYYNWNGSLLRTVNETWNNQYELATKKTTLNDVQPPITSEVAYFYDPTGVVLVGEIDEYDFGQSAPTRKTVTNYASFAPTPLYPSGPSIQDRPSSVIIYNGSGTRVAETDYAYDGSAVSPMTGIDGHDDTNYGSSYNVRGNATKVTRQCFPSCTNAITTYKYDQTGQITSMTDPCGSATCGDMTGTNHTTLYSYADSFTTCGGSAPSGSTNAYLTKVTDPLGHIASYCYGYNDGQLRGATDPNLQTTTYAYNDSLGRPTSATYPDGGQTTYSYNDTPPSPTVTTSKLIVSGRSLTDIATMDGMGHQVGTQLTSDPEGTIYTATTYDGLGHAYTTSNPYRSTSDPTYGVTTYSYDALGRIKLVVPPDGTSTNNNVATQYCGATTLVTDQAGRSRRSTSDALGHLVEVDEPNSTTATVNVCPAQGDPVWITTYGYDALDDLYSVVQGGSHNRGFVYDSLKRLTSSTNPETGNVAAGGTVSYTYDANGNVSTKKDGRGTTSTITYSYDNLNRMIGKSYANTDPSVSYAYDQTTCVVVPTCYNVGRRTSMTEANGSESWAYDKMGRLWGQTAYHQQHSKDDRLHLRP